MHEINCIDGNEVLASLKPNVPPHCACKLAAIKLVAILPPVWKDKKNQSLSRKK